MSENTTTTHLEGPEAYVGREWVRTRLCDGQPLEAGEVALTNTEVRRMTYLQGRERLSCWLCRQDLANIKS